MLCSRGTNRKHCDNPEVLVATALGYEQGTCTARRVIMTCIIRSAAPASIARSMSWLARHGRGMVDLYLPLWRRLDVCPHLVPTAYMPPPATLLYVLHTLCGTGRVLVCSIFCRRDCGQWQPDHCWHEWHWPCQAWPLLCLQLCFDQNFLFSN